MFVFLLARVSTGIWRQELLEARDSRNRTPLLAAVHAKNKIFSKYLMLNKRANIGDEDDVRPF